MRRSLGWATPLPAPTNVGEGFIVRAPSDGTPPSPSMKPSPPLSFDIGTIDHFGTDVGALAAEAGAIGKDMAVSETNVSPMITRMRMQQPYFIPRHGVLVTGRERVN